MISSAQILPGIALHSMAFHVYLCVKEEKLPITDPCIAKSFRQFILIFFFHRVFWPNLSKNTVCMRVCGTFTLIRCRIKISTHFAIEIKINHSKWKWNDIQKNHEMTLCAVEEILFLFLFSLLILLPLQWNIHKMQWFKEGESGKMVHSKH